MDAHEQRVWISYAYFLVATCTSLTGLLYIPNPTARSLVAGSWVNMSLFTTEVALCVFYLRRWKLAPVYKYGFTLMVVNDLLGTLCVCANLFLFVADPVKSLWQWPIPALLLSTALSAFLEQTFLLHRYWKVTRHTIISAFIMLVAVAHMILSIVVVGLGGPYKKYLVCPGIDLVIAAIICASTDVLIALSMVWSMSGINPMWASTQHLIRSVCINAVTSGAVVATVTLLAMITLIVKDINEAAIFTPFFAAMGRVYALTVLVNFIHRHRRLSVPNSLHVTEHVQSHAPVSIVVGGLVPTPSADFRSEASTGESDSACVLDSVALRPGPQGETSVVPELYLRVKYPP
ncbi:hypothetical protein FB451DRAFT_704794 [Mycena latifolia]|nr:hypothetical protein FB451DRAFT_704794 [Mycena latifolia]